MDNSVDIRNSIEYGCLESYVSIIESCLNVYGGAEIWIACAESIKLENPAAWSAAKEDFELYRFW